VGIVKSAFANPQAVDIVEIAFANPQAVDFVKSAYFISKRKATTVQLTLSGTLQGRVSSVTQRKSFLQGGSHCASVKSMQLIIGKSLLQG